MKIERRKSQSANSTDKVFAVAVSQTLISSNSYRKVASKPLKECLNLHEPGLGDLIDGVKGEVVELEFENGTGLRILCPIKGEEEPFELPVSTKSSLVEGDIVDLRTVEGILLKRAGSKPTLKYDGDLYVEEDTDAADE